MDTPAAIKQLHRGQLDKNHPKLYFTVKIEIVEVIYDLKLSLVFNFLSQPHNKLL